MTEPLPAACQTCPAPVFWAETEKGARMLVDAEPVVGGNLRLLPRDGGRDPVVVSVAKHLAFGATFYVSHFATCPDAARHRRRGKGAA